MICKAVFMICSPLLWMTHDRSGSVAPGTPHLAFEMWVRRTPVSVQVLDTARKLNSEARSGVGEPPIASIHLNYDLQSLCFEDFAGIATAHFRDFLLWVHTEAVPKRLLLNTLGTQVRGWGRVYQSNSDHA